MTLGGGRGPSPRRFWASGDPYERITLALVLHSLIVLSLIGTVVFVVLQSMLRDRMRSEIQRDTIQIVQQLEHAVDIVQEDLANLAANSLLVNAIVDTEGNKAYVTPFIRSYRSRGGVLLRLTLCDFTGKGLATNAPRPVSYPSKELLRRTVDEGRPFGDVIGRASGGVWENLLLAYPVIWEGTGKAEGVLVAEIGIEELISDALGDVRQAQDMGVRLRGEGTTLFSRNAIPDRSSHTTTGLLQVAPPLAALGLEVEVIDYRRIGLGRFIVIYTAVAGALLVLSFFPARTLSRTLTTQLKQAQDERRLLEAKVQQAQKLESLGVLAGGIAHDFNNLLMGVLGNADLALAKLPPGSELRPYLELIETTAARAAELTNQMLAYSGRGRFVVERVDLSGLVREMGQLLETVISKQVKIRYRLAPGLPAVEADATQLRQVVMNLITNASDALGAGGGEVVVETGVVDAAGGSLQSSYPGEPLPAGTYVFLEVADGGIGMEAGTVERIFDPFFTTKQTGRGLGLAAVLGIVRGHKGGIAVASEPGRGTAFKIFLPGAAAAETVAATAAPAEAAAVARAAGASRRTVLVVDDEPLVLQVARIMLEECGYAVVTAADGVEALELFRGRRSEISAVLLDMTMPRMGGAETWREMRRIDPGVRVILSSGYSETDAMTHFPGAAPAGFVQKPYRMAVLREKLRLALEPAGRGAGGVRVSPAP